MNATAKPQIARARRTAAARQRSAPTSKVKSRRRQPEAARLALLETGNSIFNSAGYFATNSNAIAKAAGYAPGTFYTHFPDKMGLFLEVYERWVAAEWRAVEQGIKASEPGEARVHAVVRAIAQNHRRSRRFRESLRALSALEPAVRERQNMQRRRQIEWLIDLCVRQGWQRPDKSTCAVVLLSLERGLDAMAEGDAEVLGTTASALCAELGRMVWRLIGPRAR